MMRQHPKTIGAPLAQTGLRQQRKNRTHGVVAGAANNTPPCVGAVLAQTALRAYPRAPALRHWPALPPDGSAWPKAHADHHNIDRQGDHLASHKADSPRGRRVEDLVGGKGMLIINQTMFPDRKCCGHRQPSHSASPVRRCRLALTGQRAIGTRISDPRRPLCREQQDQQSISLLAVGAAYVVFSRLFTIAGLRSWRWECHGKSGRWRCIGRKGFTGAATEPTAAYACAIRCGCQALAKPGIEAIFGMPEGKRPPAYGGGRRN